IPSLSLSLHLRINAYQLSVKRHIPIRTLQHVIVLNPKIFLLLFKSIIPNFLSHTLPLSSPDLPPCTPFRSLQSSSFALLASREHSSQTSRLALAFLRSTSLQNCFLSQSNYYPYCFSDPGI
ncbi:hypothetical protein F2P56_011189, partial [Juglans regia]